MAQDWANHMNGIGSLVHRANVGADTSAYGVSWQRAGENIARGQPDVASVGSAWYNSPPHRANILGDFTDIGCGSQGAFWACNFAKVAGACFPGDALVWMANGERKSISSLQSGDALLDELGAATTFVSWIKREDANQLLTQSIEYMRHSSNVTERLTLSPNHHLYVRASTGAKQLVFAWNVQVGDFLIGGSREDEQLRVTGVTWEEKLGVYAPLTLSGSLVVDGVLVSNYAEFPPSDQLLIHAAMAPLRAAYHLLPRSIFARVAAVENGFHWWPRALVTCWQTLLGEKPLTSFIPSSLMGAFESL